MLARTCPSFLAMLPTRARLLGGHTLTTRFTGAAACCGPAASPSPSFGSWRPLASGTRSGAVTVLCIARRHVQYEQTSETIRGINKSRFSGKKRSKAGSGAAERAKAEKWITKSTKDYLSEADSKQREEAQQLEKGAAGDGATTTSKGAASLISQQREELREQSAARRERIKQVSAETDRQFELEMDRMREDDSSRFKKTKNFFKRQGKAFVIFWTAAYVGTFVLLYLCFATGLVKKDAAFEFMFFFLGSYIDRDAFYRRVEAWDTYVNVGFAFLINEMIEIIRFPLIIFLFYQFRPLVTGMNRRVKPSIFKSSAAES